MGSISRSDATEEEWDRVGGLGCDIGVLIEVLSHGFSFN